MSTVETRSRPSSANGTKLAPALAAIDDQDISPVSNVDNTPTTLGGGSGGKGFNAPGIASVPSMHRSFHPPADTTTYRDLLLFEERLKMNAEMLKRRRRRYSAFLWSFVAALMYLAHWLLFIPPITLLALRALQATVAVVLITLALFFASGMYEEKIRYAHSYINHSNRALRQLNMHLNMRRQRQPLPSLLPPFLRPSSAKPTIPTPPKSSPPNSRSSSSSSIKSTNTLSSSTFNSRRTVVNQIPPSSNPRGELIFSSVVDKSFREGYERYRAAFERRREEKAREEARRSARRWFILNKKLNDVGGAGISRGFTPTPPASRKGTPPPGLGGTIGDGRPRRGRSPSPAAMLNEKIGNTMNTNTTTTPVKGTRERGESYSFVASTKNDENALKKSIR